MPDWERESGRMASIYENSDLNICATHAQDGNAGIFSGRDIARGTLSPWILEPWKTGVECVLVSSSSQLESPLTTRPLYARLLFEHHFRTNLTIQRNPYTGYIQPYPGSEPLLSRAWVLQERLLSQRRLDYLKSEILWECHESRKCECKEADIQPFKTPTSRFVEKLSASADSAEDASDIWTSTVEQYTSFSLSLHSDILPALSGVAQRVAPAKRSEYLAGLWRCDLPKSLLWYRATYSGFWDEYPSPYIGKRHSDYQAPTWSWASGEGAVMFCDIDQNSWESLTQIIDHQYQTKGEDPFGHCARASLTLIAPAVEGKLQLEGILEVSDEEKNVHFTLQLRRVPPFELYLDIDPFTSRSAMSGREPFLGFPVLCLEIGLLHLGDGKNVTFGLILKKTGIADTFERIGLFKHVHKNGNNLDFSGVAAGTVTIV